MHTEEKESKIKVFWKKPAVRIGAVALVTASAVAIGIGLYL